MGDPPSKRVDEAHPTLCMRGKTSDVAVSGPLIICHSTAPLFALGPQDLQEQSRYRVQVAYINGLGAGPYR
jgi:hypothetical protein